MDARDRALRYLNARMCSCEQMRSYLLRKGHEEEEIEPVIAELLEYHYLDDLRYAEVMIRSGFDKGRGIRRIRSDLRAKGVSPEIIAEAEEAMEETPDEYAMAEEIARSILSGIDSSEMDYREKEKLKARIARRLAGRGFSTEIIYRVIGRLV